jgi:hypothetical protein
VTGAQGFYIDDTWLQQTVLHEMSFSIPSARYADKADGISENARSLWSGRGYDFFATNRVQPMGTGCSTLDPRLRGDDRWADGWAVRNAVD